MAKSTNKSTKRSKKRTDSKRSPKKSQRYKSFKLEKKIVVDKSHILSGPKLTKATFSFLKQNWKLFGKITLIYLAIYVVFIRVATTFSLTETRDLIDTFYPGTNQFLLDLTLTGLVSSTSVTVGGVNFIVGLFLALFTSLAFIRAIRLTTNGEETSLRDSYYNGMQPVVPFLLIILLAFVQLLPFAAGGFLYLAVVGGGIVVGFFEQLLFIVIWMALTILTAYWISNTIMALYAVTIPDMYPVSAIRATGEVLAHKRFTIFRRLLFLMFLLFVFNGGLILLAIMLREGLAFYIRDLAAVASLPIIHIYLYKLYRSTL